MCCSGAEQLQLFSFDFPWSVLTSSRKIIATLPEQVFGKQLRPRANSMKAQRASCVVLMQQLAFSRERLRRVLGKKTSAKLRIIYIFTSSTLHIHILTYISAHLYIYILICTSTSLLIFIIFTHLHLCSSSSSSHIYISAHVHSRGQPSAELVRVEGAKCRRECV